MRIKKQKRNHIQKAQNKNITIAINTFYWKRTKLTVSKAFCHWIGLLTCIEYHNIKDDIAITSTNVDLFDAEMKYLHDNGFNVLTMADLGYDEDSNYLYIRSDNK